MFPSTALPPLFLLESRVGFGVQGVRAWRSGSEAFDLGELLRQKKATHTRVPGAAWNLGERILTVVPIHANYVKPWILKFVTAHHHNAHPHIQQRPMLLKPHAYSANSSTGLIWSSKFSQNALNLKPGHRTYCISIASSLFT